MFVAGLQKLEMVAVDLRFYEAVLAWHHGHTKKWFFLTESMKSRYNGYLTDFQCSHLENLPFQNSKAVRSFQLNTQDHAMYVNVRKICLRKYPMIEKLLVHLSNHPSGVSLPELFHSIYGFEYEERLNKKRMESLIDRSRQLLGSKSLIERRNERLRLIATEKSQALKPNRPGSTERSPLC